MFDGPFYYMPIPVDKDGNGPCYADAVVNVEHEVWDGNCATVCRCADEATARWIVANMPSASQVAEIANVASYDDWFVEEE
jgi:hypothetical protein